MTAIISTGRPEDRDETERFERLKQLHAAALEGRVSGEAVTYRVGRSLGRTIYRQVGDEPSKADTFLGIMETPEHASSVVDALNAAPHPHDAYQVTCLGCGVVTYHPQSCDAGKLRINVERA